jgi:hypothetical protein
MRNHRRTRTSQTQRRALLVLTMSTSLSMLGPVFTASAAEHHPTGEFARFADCPLNNPTTQKCFIDETNSGIFVLGKHTIPIVKTIIMQAGMSEAKKHEEMLIPAEDGETMSKTTLSIPGGLLGLLAPTSLPPLLRGALDEDLEKGLTAVTSTVELADPTSPGTLNEYNLLGEEETGMRLALRVKLSNPFLGTTCYIGTSSNPILLTLTTGTTSPPQPNRPISGTSGSGSFLAEGFIVSLADDSLVDNAFSAPTATGCGGTSSTLIDTAIDTEIGLPSPSGHNTAILDGTVVLATAYAVREHE